MADWLARFRLDGPVSMAVTTLNEIVGALASAEREVLVMGTFGEILGTARRVVPRRGVRYRFVLPGNVHRSKTATARLVDLADAGAWLRTAPRVPVDTLVVDKALAVFPGRRAVSGDAVVVGLSSIVATTTELFERTWAGGAPFVPHCANLAPGLGSRGREVLHLLSAGWGDEMVAARLGVSVRTVRREIAVILDRLDARSRFQAGVRAAVRGWLVP